VTRRRRRAIVIALALALSSGPLAAQPYPGPPDSDAAYWEVPAFKEFPYKGPSKAVGVLFWSHGVFGQNVQWTAPPPPFVRDFARAGWDVVKINRNNMLEHGWSQSGTRHVAHLIALARKAKADGYRYIIAAGQSYGGAISLEAAAEPGLFFGVIATAPGHGSDACSPNTSSRRESDNLPLYLTRAIGRAKAPRVVVTMAADDECQGFNRPTGDIRRALTSSVDRFVFLDDTMPIHGHAAALTNQFARWYGACLVAFLDPTRTPGATETRCTVPPALTRFLFPAKFTMPAPPPDDGASLIGGWSGTLKVDDSYGLVDRDICIVVRDAASDGFAALVLFGAGPDRRASMATARRTFARDGDGFVYTGRREYRMRLTRGGPDTLTLAITSANGNRRFIGTLKRGC
jgi:hypothetical protein